MIFFQSVCVYKVKVDSFPVVKTRMNDLPKVSDETNRIMGSFEERIASIEQKRYTRITSHIHANPLFSLDM